LPHIQTERDNGAALTDRLVEDATEDAPNLM